MFTYYVTYIMQYDATLMNVIFLSAKIATTLFYQVEKVMDEIPEEPPGDKSV